MLPALVLALVAPSSCLLQTRHLLAHASSALCVGHLQNWDAATGVSLLVVCGPVCTRVANLFVNCRFAAPALGVFAPPLGFTGSCVSLT